ncbi:hypothetical protein ACIQWL_14695 [Streptomyces mirabilis]|uniref:hypothetical protein n=1 Tax=Streptomyces mirabilis TaxID=68239 RepID=UPI000765A832|nr:hypothetical protein [Streptomyces mirabilis]
MVDDWPLWWPGVRRVRRVDDQSGAFLLRSLLPFDLDHRPLFRANHYLLTYRGHRGLKAWLDGGQEARRAHDEERRSGTRSE